MTDPATARGEGFPPARRVRRRAEFLRAQKGGRRHHAAHFTVILYDRGDSELPRLGLVTSRKVGNAVRRNRIRRTLRELFRLEMGRFPTGFDVVIIAKDGAAALDSGAIRDEIHAALAKRRAGPPASSRRPGGGATS